MDQATAARGRGVACVLPRGKASLATIAALHPEIEFMLMPTGSPPAGTDRVWSIMLSQLERASLPRQPARQQPRESRYAIRLVQRAGQEPVAPGAVTTAEVFDAMSCMVVACSSVGREVNTRSSDDGSLLVCFVARQHAARVMARLGPVLASCNERLRDSPWEVVAARTDVH